ncbi:MAG: hypothetical protein JW902_18230 [Syntrophaceae bacterium]|nr:hypothetical protein [Syntrophaceae bacterium]
MALASPEARAQTGSNGKTPEEPDGMVSVNIKAHQCPSADLAIVLIGWNPWIPWPGKDSCAPGSAGEYTFRIKSGFSWPLTIYPIEAIDQDDGTVSLWWSIWSDDPVIIEGQRHPSANPLSGGSRDINTTKYTVLAPRLEIVDAPSSVQRDEIFDVTITAAPQTFFAGRTIQFGLSQGESTAVLGERGTVQMYDIGAIATDGAIVANQTSYTFTADDSEQKPFKGVVNLTQDIRLTVIDTAMPDLTDESDSIAVTHRMRQYTTEYGNTPVNDFDDLIEQWVDYWDDWNYPADGAYTFKTTDLDGELVKALCYKESTMKDVDLMQLTGEAKEGLEGDRDWNWNVAPYAHDPEKGDLYSTEAHPEMEYTGVSDTSASESLKWGIRWLYAKKSKGQYDRPTNSFYNPQWYDWEKTLAEYNSDADPFHSTYVTGVTSLYLYGANPHGGNPAYLWPILTNGFPRE